MTQSTRPDIETITRARTHLVRYAFGTDGGRLPWAEIEFFDTGFDAIVAYVAELERAATPMSCGHMPREMYPLGGYCDGCHVREELDRAEQRVAELRRGIATQAAEIVAPRARAAAKSCPCEIVEPCEKMCSCARPYMSGGCSRCCKYGSAEQQRVAAERLATQAATIRGLTAELEAARRMTVDLLAVATGSETHRNVGRCPTDEGTGTRDRDHTCPACEVLSRADTIVAKGSALCDS